jgi:type II secretory pathway component GspD/PulD (secretin)
VRRAAHRPPLTHAAAIGALACLLLACPAPARAAGSDAVAFPLTFENADIQVVIRAVAKATGTPILFDPDQVRGRITLWAPHDVTSAEAVQLLRSTLALHGYALVVRPESIWIVPADAPPDYTFRVVPLRYADAAVIAMRLAQLAPPGVRIVPYPPTNSLILSGPRAGVDALDDLIRAR